MKKSVNKYLALGLIATFTLSGFTCSKHVPVATPEPAPTEESVPQDQMSDSTTTQPAELTPADDSLIKENKENNK